MSEPEDSREHFLARWSRRKQEADREPTAEQNQSARPRDPPTHKASAGESQSAEALAKAESGDPEPQTPARQAALDSRLRGNERGERAESAKDPEFDVSTLPPIESIGAETDITMFLQKGVPAELARAALRRVWTADPTIRDFIGIAENQYDFASGDIPGFGPLKAIDNVSRMVADVVREGVKRVESATVEPAGEVANDSPEPPVSTAESVRRPEPAPQALAASGQEQPTQESSTPSSEEDIVHRTKVTVAMQQDSDEDEPKSLPMRRPHGRALPE